MQKSAPNKDRKSSFGDPSLEFVIAWSFFRPLFEQPAVVEYLGKKQPEFVLSIMPRQTLVGRRLTNE
jgi:hypothetical protein